MYFPPPLDQVVGHGHQAVFERIEIAIQKKIRIDILVCVRHSIDDALTHLEHYDENGLLDVCFDDGNDRLEKLEEWRKEGKLRIRWTTQRINPPYVIVDESHIGLDVPQDVGTTFSPRRADFIFGSKVVAAKLRQKFRSAFRQAKAIDTLRRYRTNGSIN